MFLDSGFTPIGGQTIRTAPTIYAYRTETDTLKEVMAPGYFSTKSILFGPGNVIKVLTADEIGEIYVKAIEGKNVIFDNRVILAAPYKVEPKAVAPVKKKDNERTKKAA